MPAGPAGAPDVRVLVYRPKEAIGALPLIREPARWRLRPSPGVHFLPATLAWPCWVPLSWPLRYRIVPDDPSVRSEDCYAALCWAVHEWRSNRSGWWSPGECGGALAAAVAFMVVSRGGPAIALQALMIPVSMIAARRHHGASSRRHPCSVEVRHEACGTTISARPIGPRSRPYRRPGAHRDLAGLPPAFIQVGGLTATG